MTKDDFQDNAGIKGKTEKAGTSTTRTSVVHPFMLMPPAPKPPFGMPVATKINVLPVITTPRKEDVESCQKDHHDSES